MPTGAIPLVRALGGGRLRELAVEEGAGEAIASPSAPMDADLGRGRRRGGAGRGPEAVVHALVAEAAVGLEVHGRRLGFVGLGRRRGQGRK